MGALLKKLLQRILGRRGRGAGQTDRTPDNVCVARCRPPPRPAQSPLRRHDLCRARGNTDRTRSDVNSVYDRTVDVAADMSAINAGAFTNAGDNIVVNGRTYGLHADTGRTFPVSGPGIHQLSRSEHQFLRMLNERGRDAATEFGRNLPGLSDDAMNRVLELWEMCR